MNKDRPTSTCDGGSAWVPIACRSNAITTMIRVKLVHITRIAGASDSTVNSTTIDNDELSPPSKSPPPAPPAPPASPGSPGSPPPRPKGNAWSAFSKIDIGLNGSSGAESCPVAATASRLPKTTTAATAHDFVPSSFKTCRPVIGHPPVSRPRPKSAAGRRAPRARPASGPSALRCRRRPALAEIRGPRPRRRD